MSPASYRAAPPRVVLVNPSARPAGSRKTTSDDPPAPATRPARRPYASGALASGPARSDDEGSARCRAARSAARGSAATGRRSVGAGRSASAACCACWNSRHRRVQRLQRLAVALRSRRRPARPGPRRWRPDPVCGGGQPAGLAAVRRARRGCVGSPSGGCRVARWRCRRCRCPASCPARPAASMPSLQVVGEHHVRATVAVARPAPSAAAGTAFLLAALHVHRLDVEHAVADGQREQVAVHAPGPGCWPSRVELADALSALLVIVWCAWPGPGSGVWSGSSSTSSRGLPSTYDAGDQRRQVLPAVRGERRGELEPGACPGRATAVSR